MINIDSYFKNLVIKADKDWMPYARLSELQSSAQKIHALVEDSLDEILRICLYVTNKELKFYFLIGTDSAIVPGYIQFNCLI